MICSDKVHLLRRVMCGIYDLYFKPQTCLTEFRTSLPAVFRQATRNVDFGSLYVPVIG